MTRSTQPQGSTAWIGLEGRWSGWGETYPNPWGPAGPTVGTWHFYFDRVRLNLIHDYVEKRQTGECFEAHGVLTIDPVSQDVLWFWFDAYGHPPLTPARGRWQGSLLTLEKVTPRGIGRTTFTWSTDELLCGMNCKLTGTEAFIPIMSGRYVRVPQAASQSATTP